MCRDLQRTACSYPGCINFDTPKPWTIQCPTFREWVRQSEERGFALPPYSYTRCPAGFTPEPYPRWGNPLLPTDYCEFHKAILFPELFGIDSCAPQDQLEAQRTVDSFVARFTGGPLANEDPGQDMWGEAPRGTDFPRWEFQTIDWGQDGSKYPSNGPPISPRTASRTIPPSVPNCGNILNERFQGKQTVPEIRQDTAAVAGTIVSMASRKPKS